MGKIVFRETIIALLVSIAVLLILSVVLYNYMPSNKVIPETVEYTPTKEIQEQLSSAVEDTSKEVIVTYEVTANDLNNFEKTNEYNPGKANPFAAASESSTGDTTGNSTGETTTDSTDSNSNNQGGGHIFENGSDSK